MPPQPLPPTSPSPPTADTRTKLCSAPTDSSTYITRLLVGMKNSLHALEAKPSDEQLEDWAVLIHDCMSRSSRNYHSVQHVFDIAQDESDPILVLAAFFHDVVYFHVDGGFSTRQASILKGVIDKTSENSDWHLTTDTSDTLLNMVEDIFGFTPGQAVACTSGLNEFLSAVVAVRKLEPVLSRADLACIACCIEATIPFRPTNDQTPSTMDILFDRMMKANDKYELGMTEEDLVKAVQRAARTSNLDVLNFSTKDREWFLDNTWSLLPETNESLRDQYLYSVQEFQKALFNLYGFFSFLQPSRVFVSFRGVPSPVEIKLMTMEAARNIEIGRTYVRAKVLSISVLAAFAVLTGGDAPMALLIGDLSSRQNVSRKLRDLLPTPPPERLRNCDVDVYNILLKGRTQETSFDIRQSPMAAYLYGWMGDKAVEELIRDREICPMDADKAKDLLSHMPRNIVERVAENLADVAVSRASAIRAVMEELPRDNGECEDLSGA